ncbi:hypothetical protein C7475_1021075 [Chitinophaga sp. S165]|nr:hypothetical protein C7475_1021075 [Chitinophaga sp. S165]
MLWLSLISRTHHFVIFETDCQQQIFLYLGTMINTYRFRAESKQDVLKLQRILRGEYEISPVRGGTSGVEVHLESPFTIEEIIRFIESLPNSNVMYQTIDLEEKYTGEMNHARYRNINN